MRLLVLDTETSGLPQTKILSQELLELWPHIVQFSYLIYDTTTNAVTKIKDSILNIPQDIVMSEEVVQIHGITNARTQESTVTFGQTVDEFYQDLKSVDIIVGHNLSFDLNVIKAELLREKEREKEKEGEKDKNRRSRRLQSLPPLSSSNHQQCLELLLKKETKKEFYCTMMNSIELCNIKAVSKYGKQYVKFPKLAELHNKLFHVTPRLLHNALHDVIICLRCYLKICFNVEVSGNTREMTLALI
jgi:DNA polymerase III epsilon subunit-like protein